MPNYHRMRVAGGSYFFTAVSASRRPILTTDLGRECLRTAIADVQREYPFELVAIVLLPEHWHSIWNLPAGDDDYSTRWSLLKRKFTDGYLKGGGKEAPISDSRRKKGERGIWQRRFFEHVVRDTDELKRIVDYIHWNPKKHGLVRRVCDWPWSSFHRFVESGDYTINWGGEEPEGYTDEIFSHDC